MNKKIIILKLSEKFNTDNLSTRESVKMLDMELRKILNSVNVPIFKIQLDFMNIFQISRSFADEILKLKKNYRAKKIELEFVNMNDFAQKMIELVSVSLKTHPHHVNVAASTILDLSSI